MLEQSTTKSNTQYRIELRMVYNQTWHGENRASLLCPAERMP